jgi:nitrite reductase/ring-hydroxylating ferredoxin subunit
MAADITRVLDSLTSEQQATLDQYADALQTFIDRLVERGGAPAQQFKNFLNGTWLGHPLHPVLTDVPLGAWFGAAVLDLVGAEDAADAAYSVGVLAVPPTVCSGVADWDNLSGEPRRTGLLHALLNASGTALIVSSLVARRTRRRGLGMALSMAGLACAAAAAWLGGRLVYSLGAGIARTAFEPLVEDFTPVMPANALAAGQLTQGDLDVEGKTLALVLFKRGDAISAISATCTHAGGNLADGELVEGDCVACPWHGSRFSLTDGSVRRGPASVPAPVFEVRVREGQIEVRRRR